MNFAEVRKLTIVALFSDDKLYEQIVLKGGNALNLVYGLSPRTSLDLDFSIDRDFADLEDTRRRIFRALEDRFAAAGFVVFDQSFEPKPQVFRAESGTVVGRLRTQVQADRVEPIPGSRREP
jgi:predicted nucleotidyltransferase component of viral defense system